MLEKFRKKLVLQFTVLVIFLIVFNSLAIMAFDYFTSMTEDKAKTKEIYQNVYDEFQLITIDDFSNFLLENGDIRVFDENRKVIFKGEFFDSNSDVYKPGFQRMVTEVKDNGEAEQEASWLYGGDFKNSFFNGKVQIMRESEVSPDDIYELLSIFMIQTFLVGILVFLLGRYFAKKSLKPAEEMVEKLEHFTHDASHQLKTPLAIMSANVDLALKNKKYEIGFKNLKNEIKNATDLVNKLLGLAEVDGYKFVGYEIEISKLVLKVIEQQDRLKGIFDKYQIEQDIDDNIKIRGDENLVQQIIINIIDNAIKFNVPHGKIEIKLTKTSFLVANTVADNLDIGELNKIFDRFFRRVQDDQTEGHGIGLALVKRIAQLYNWRVEARMRNMNIIEIEVIF